MTGWDFEIGTIKARKRGQLKNNSCLVEIYSETTSQEIHLYPGEIREIYNWLKREKAI
jgi:hypothetical protein